MSSVNAIFETFQLSNEEYQELEDEFGKLCHKIYWELKRKNTRNNSTDDIDDVMQELRWSMVRAGCYYKRQTYLEECIESAKEHISDPFLLALVEELQDLWKKRTRHGANRQCFGSHQEELLEMIVTTNISDTRRPKKDVRLSIDKKFRTYCKAIAWNCQKSLGKKITRERSIRSGLVSLSEHDYLIGSSL